MSQYARAAILVILCLCVSAIWAASARALSALEGDIIRGLFLAASALVVGALVIACLVHMVRGDE